MTDETKGKPPAPKVQVIRRAPTAPGQAPAPAVRPAVAHEVIDTLKDGQLLFAYYPDQQWLANSRFFRCRAGQASRAGASRPAGGR